jgi:hypothetical protein
VGLDQCLFAPSFIALFFSAQGALEGKSMTQIKEKLNDGYPQALLNNYKVWHMATYKTTIQAIYTLLVALASCTVLQLLRHAP